MHLTSQLRHTKAVHTDELQKSFECKECGRTFKQSRDLARHSRVHTGEKPFKCQLCGRDFGRADTLKVHLRTHKNEPQYSEGLRSFTLLNPPPLHTDSLNDSTTTDRTTVDTSTTDKDTMDNNTVSPVASTALSTEDTNVLSTIDLTVLSTTTVSVESSHVLVNTVTATTDADRNMLRRTITQPNNDIAVKNVNREQSLADDLASPLFFATFQTTTATETVATKTTLYSNSNLTSTSTTKTIEYVDIEKKTSIASSLTEEDDSTITPRYYVELPATHDDSTQELGRLETPDTTIDDNPKSPDQEASSESMAITPRDYNEARHDDTNFFVMMREEEKIAQLPTTTIAEKESTIATETSQANTSTNLLENVVVKYLPLLENGSDSSLVIKDEGETPVLTPDMGERTPINTHTSSTSPTSVETTTTEEGEVDIGMTVTLNDDGNGMLVMVASENTTHLISSEQNLEFSSSEK